MITDGNDMGGRGYQQFTSCHPLKQMLLQRFLIIRLIKSAMKEKRSVESKPSACHTPVTVDGHVFCIAVLSLRRFLLGKGAEIKIKL